MICGYVCEHIIPPEYLFPSRCTYYHIDRFPVSKLEEKPPDAPPSPSPDHRFGKPREGVGVLDMGKQPGRWDGRDFEDEVRVMF